MPERTPSQTVGPFFSFGLCERPAAELAPRGAPGSIEIRGRVLDGAGEGVPDAMVETWQADGAGEYRRDWGFARCGTDTDGAFRFSTVRPGAVAGPDGTLQAPHLEVLAFARGLLKPVLTRMYFPDAGRANATDPVLAAVGEADGRSTLVAARDAGSYVFDIHLQGDRQTVFFAL